MPAETCADCGGNGDDYLVPCINCEKLFCLECVEPVLDIDSDPSADWMCEDCE